MAVCADLSPAVVRSWLGHMEIDPPRTTLPFQATKPPKSVRRITYAMMDLRTWNGELSTATTVFTRNINVSRILSATGLRTL